MTDPDTRPAPPGGDLDFLCVDGFLRTLVDARALKTAFELRLIDLLVERGSAPAAVLQRSLGIDETGLRFLLGLLQANGVTEPWRGEVRLKPAFTAALRFRDLLEVKLDFAGFLLNDFADCFTLLVRDPAGFTANSRLFELFDYRRGLERSIENYERTRAWMRLTSVLTRYEALACLGLYDFGGHRRMLDVGGNSGEFLLQACRRHAQLGGTVLDLPLVCEIGLEHVLGEPEGGRIGFLQADVRQDALPRGFDLISFKSMLHDWPEDEALGFLSRAAEALEPGGTLLVFERGPIDPRGGTPPFSMLPILLFFRSYRQPTAYMKHLQSLGLEAVERRDITLDTPFFLVTARKPGPVAGSKLAR